MNILLCHKDIAPNESSGGFSNAYCNLGEQYADMGHQVVLLTRRKGLSRYHHENIELIEGNSDDIDFMNMLIKEKKIDIIETPSWNHELYRYSGPQKTAPMVTRVDFPARYFQKSAEVIAKEESMVKNSDGLIVISDWVRREWSSITGKNIPIIPYGVSKINIADHKRAKDVVWVGKATWMKGIDFLPLIAAELKSKGFNLQLIITPLANQYQDNDSLNFLKENDVTIYSNLSTAEYNQLMQKATYILSTARKEGFCIAVLEGMANGLIPVVPDWVGGTLDFVNSDNGIVYSSISEISELLEQCQPNEKYSKVIETASRLSWRNSAEQSLQVYEETIKNWAGR